MLDEINGKINRFWVWYGLYLFFEYVSVHIDETYT